MFSREYCEISKNIYFEEYLGTAASEVTLRSNCLGLSVLTAAFKTRALITICAHILSSNLTPKLSF